MYKRYTTKYINVVSFVCTLIIFSIIYIISTQIEHIDISKQLSEKMQNTIKVEFQSVEQQEKVEDAKTEENLWALKIPQIGLEAKIAEGTTEEVLNSDIGHFTETSKTNGTIGLAAHNRGYPVNYFSKIKSLKKGDIIQYQYKDFKKQYTVEKNYIIKDTDWTNLEQTEENKITLITCVEDEPSFRRCVIGKEKI